MPSFRVPPRGAPSGWTMAAWAAAIILSFRASGNLEDGRIYALAAAFVMGGALIAYGLWSHWHDGRRR